jgi:hypothetical protein
MCASDFDFEGDPTRMRLVVKSGVGQAVAITAVLYGILVFGRLAFHRWDATFFITAGRFFCEHPGGPNKLFIGRPTGYDGQFYYRLALHPFTATQFGDGIRIDNPPYRQQRILYPLLSHALAFGNPRWVPWSMIAVNYLAVCGLAFSAARLAELFAVPAIYGLTIAFLPGVLLGLDRDLTDPLAIFLAVSALCLLHRRRITLAACILALAVLARETVVLLAVALLMNSAWRALRKRSAWSDSAPLLIPLAACAAWQWWIFSRWATFGPPAGNANWGGLTFSAGALLIRATRSAFDLHPLQLAELSYLGAMVLLAAMVFARSTVNTGIKLAWLGYLVLASLLSASVWVEDWAFFRGCEELMMLGVVMLMGAADRRLVAIAFATTLMTWIVLAERTLTLQ